jgi:hypothetical protein
MAKLSSLFKFAGTVGKTLFKTYKFTVIDDQFKTQKYTQSPHIVPDPFLLCFSECTHFGARKIPQNKSY